MAGWRDGPLASFAELRLRLLRRRFLARGGTAELVARIVSWVVLLPAGVIFAALIGAGAWRAARARAGFLVDVPVTAIFFGIWQAWTAMSLSMQEQEALDLRRYLLFPISSGRVYAYGLVASVLGDPFSLFWCLLLGGAFVGGAIGRPGLWLLPLAVTLVLFAAATAAYLALLQEGAARLLRGRRLRGLAVASLYVGLAFVLFSLQGKGAQALRDWLEVLSVLQWLGLPGALAAGAARALFGNHLLGALPWMGALALTAVGAGFGAFRLALGAATSGDGGASSEGAARGLGWRLELLPGRLGPLLERETKQLLRHPLTSVLLLVIPGLAGILTWKALPLLPAEAGEVVRALPLAGFAVYVHLATQVFWLNGFGWDRGGARLFFLAPLDPAEVLVAKNLATYGLSLAVFVLCAGVMAALGGLPPAWAVLGALALHLGLAPLFLGVGNVVAVLNPRAAALTLQRSGSLPALSGLAGMAIVAGGVALFALPVLLALRLDSGWVLPVAWAALGAAALEAYRRTLPLAGRLLAARREPLLAAVTGDEA